MLQSRDDTISRIPTIPMEIPWKLEVLLYSWVRMGKSVGTDGGWDAMKTFYFLFPTHSKLIILGSTYTLSRCVSHL